jgi:pyruvate/2-oxoglutarate dehydrogenase complex dihydrolipoamide dehydrogenase (E3) component/uncharacterized membrane protein YdjX (TVP38/TMEM64 family)
MKLKLVMKMILALLLVAAFLLLYSVMQDQTLNIAYVQAKVADLGVWRQSNAGLFVGFFVVIYITITALSLPFAVWLTLAAGLLFGLWWGTLIVSFASSIGATLAFLSARFVLRDWVTTKLGHRIKAIDSGLKKDGVFYLFSLRLIPVFPFFAINLLMGLTSVSTWTFYWVSQAGMLAVTIVYVNAGTQLANITSLASITSPGLIVSLVLLGLFPWLARLAVRLIERQKVYLRWSKPKTFERNLIVIGGGAAGLVSAYIGAAVKAKVTLVETHKMGGDCLNYGCVPSKALIRSAKLAHQIHHAERLGFNKQQLDFSFKKVMQRVHHVIAAIAPHDSETRYESLGVEVLNGYAKIVSPWCVEITDAQGTKKALTSKAIIIATGAAPFVPPLPGLDVTGYLTSDTLWDALRQRDKPPARFVVLGGGPIGCELAQAFARLGSNVTQVEMADRLMVREDTDVSEFVKQTLQNDGVKVLIGHQALSTKLRDGEKILTLESGGTQSEIAFDELLVAVGRVPRLKDFGLQELGIETDRVVQTNDYLETLYPNIYAAGDVAGPYQFTHAAAHQAWFASVNALFGHLWRFKADYRVMPWATFVDPEVARVGLNQQDAKAQGIAYELTRYGLDDLDRAIAEGATQGWVQVLTVPGKDKILGVTIVGAHAGELIAEFVMAMKHNLGLNQVLATIHIYPTMSEANKYVAGQWKRAHINARIMSLLARYHRWRRT